MIANILSILADFVIQTINYLGYAGVFFLMLLDSFNIPIPSEVTMPFSGFLASTGVFSFWAVVAAGTLGGYAGSVLSYYLAGWLVKNRNRMFLHVLISDTFLEKATEWFRKYGSISVFIGRVLPVIRTFISLPAGLSRMPFGKFSFLTILGSLIWSVCLTYVGWILGKNWDRIGAYFHAFDYVILAVLAAAAAWWIYKHFFSGGRNAKDRA